MTRVVAAFVAALALTGCSTFAYYNEPVQLRTESPAAERATFDIRDDRGEKDVLVMLALSGGGSRAAYFSSAVMLRLQQAFPDVDLLQEVDVISSVSGGSLPAAYYAISRDPGVRLHAEPPALVLQQPKLHYDAATRTLTLNDALTPAEIEVLQTVFTDSADRRQFDRLVRQQDAPSNRYWDDATVKDLMSRNYISRWFANWFWPDNIALYWFTAYDRSDIMAQTFADSLFDVDFTGRDLRFRDINPERPYLILNATNATEKVDPADPEFGSVFTFTKEDFRDRANSDIASYLVSRGVMTSATFPVVFNFMTLRNYNSSDDKHPRYLHLFDGGNADNLGLTSLKRIMLDREINPPQRYRKIVVMLVDSYVRSRGIDRDQADGRCWFCYVADMNVSDAVDSLLEANRANLLQDFAERMNVSKDCAKHNLPPAICRDPNLSRQIADVEKKLFFYHVRFEDSQLKGRLEKIATNFRITNDKEGRPNSIYIDAAVDELVNERNECLRHIRRIVRNEETDVDRRAKRYCTWRSN